MFANLLAAEPPYTSENRITYDANHRDLWENSKFVVLRMYFIVLKDFATYLHVTNMECVCLIDMLRNAL